MTKALTNRESGCIRRVLVAINDQDSVEYWRELLSESHETEVTTGVRDCQEKLADFAAGEDRP